MSDKQIEEKLQTIENANPTLFMEHKLKDHIKWFPVIGTNTLTWGFCSPLADNLPLELKNQVSEFMNRLTVGGYSGVRI